MQNSITIPKYLSRDGEEHKFFGREEKMVELDNGEFVTEKETGELEARFLSLQD